MFNKKILTALICLTLSGGIYTWAMDDSTAVADDTDTIVVTANRVPTIKSETPANVTTISREQIESNRYNSVSEALSHTNGVTIVDMAPGTYSAVRLNGDSRVAVLVDGQSIDNAQGMSTGRGVLDLTTLPGVKNIERIEVMKGNGSALYGSDAVGGVINIITKKGTKNETTLDLNTGSWGTHNYSLTNEGSQGKTSWFVTGNLGHRNYYKYDSDTDNGKSRGDFVQDSFTARIDQKIDDSSSVRFYTSHKSFTGNDVGYQKNYYSNQVVKSINAMQRLTNNYNITYNFKENTATPGYFRYYNNYTTTYLWSRFNSRTQGFQLQDSWIFGKNRLTGGLEWVEDKASNSASGYDGIKRTNRAAYVEDIIKSGKLSVTPGVRFDDNSAFGFHKTPKIALNYKANEKLSAYATWGRVFSAPHMDDLYTSIYYPDYFSGSYGNPNLKPETGYSQNMGINYQIDSKTSIAFDIFRSKIDNAIRWAQDPAYNYRAYNLDSEKKHGLEISLQRTINKVWNYDLGYSYTHTETDKGTGFIADSGNSQPNGYHAGIHYKKNAWQGNLQLTAGSGRNTTVYNDSSYVVLDGSVSYDATKQTTIYFKMNNMLNKGYEMYQYYPMPGRYIQAGVKYTF